MKACKTRTIARVLSDFDYYGGYWDNLAESTKMRYCRNAQAIFGKLKTPSKEQIAALEKAFKGKDIQPYIKAYRLMLETIEREVYFNTNPYYE